MQLGVQQEAQDSHSTRTHTHTQEPGGCSWSYRGQRGPGTPWRCACLLQPRRPAALLRPEGARGRALLIPQASCASTPCVQPGTAHTRLLVADRWQHSHFSIRRDCRAVAFTQTGSNLQAAFWRPREQRPGRPVTAHTKSVPVTAQHVEEPAVK